MIGPMTVQDVPYEDDPASRGLRMEGRDSLYLLAEMRVSGGVSPQPIRVRNLSPSGLMAEGSVSYAIGTPVFIELKMLLPIKGRVVWALDGRMGIALDNPIDPVSVRLETAKKPTPLAYDTRVLSPRRPGLKPR